MKIRAFLFFLFSQILTGCVAVVMAGAAAGLVVYDRRPIGIIETDTRIFHQIHSIIVSDPRFKFSRILVSSFNQEVLLVGQTNAASLRVMAEKIAQETPHVKRVYDQVTVGYPIALTQRTTDTWITSQIRSLMLTMKGLKSGSFRIVTENGVVYLMGMVTQQQAALAVSIARQVDGVQKVVKVFHYTG